MGSICKHTGFGIQQLTRHCLSTHSVHKSTSMYGHQKLLGGGGGGGGGRGITVPVCVCVCVCMCVCVCEEGRRMNRASHTHLCHLSYTAIGLKEAGRLTFNYSCRVCFTYRLRLTIY